MGVAWLYNVSCDRVGVATPCCDVITTLHCTVLRPLLKLPP